METKNLKKRSYLGDGVYAGMDEMNQIWLYTENENKIALEEDVMNNLIDYAKANQNG